jgi:hypothetical protein
MINFEQRINTYEQLTGVAREMYDSSETSLKLTDLGAKNGLINDKITEFAVAVGDVILGLVPQDKLLELLVERLGITHAEALTITAEVADFLQPLHQPASHTATSTAAEIAEMEQALAQLQPIRTMAGDAGRARDHAAAADPNTHASIPQADLLGSRQSGSGEGNPRV